MNTLCTLALVLLIDVSASVSPTHYQVQQQGLVQAFQDPQLQQLIINQPSGVAVTVQQFGTFSDTVIDWTLLRNTRDVNSFVEKLNHMERADPGPSTALGDAMRSGLQALERAPCEAEQQLIDISADGDNNFGVEPSLMRDLAQTQAVTVNGLPIVSEQDPNLADYFRREVITMDGFVIVANGYHDFGRAIRRKLSLEIARN